MEDLKCWKVRQVSFSHLSQSSKLYSLNQSNAQLVSHLWVIDISMVGFDYFVFVFDEIQIWYYNIMQYTLVGSSTMFAKSDRIS